MITPAVLAYSADGTPWSPHYGDVYHSSGGGLEQARHVFLAGNGLPERWRGRDAYTVVETGFGLGLNFLCTWQAWRDDAQRSQRLHFVSVEEHPFGRDDLQQVHANWPALAPLAAQLQGQWPPLIAGTHRLHLDGGRVQLTLLLGDAAKMLASLVASADAIYLDGFAPARNPELWSPQLLRTLTRLAAPGATLATWSVASEPRQALAAAGWRLEKRPGFGAKRQMLAGSLAGSPPPARGERSALIVGAGIAGSSLAAALAQRGWAVHLFDRQLGPALEASGNPAGILLPLPAKDDNLVARISRACYLYATQRLAQLAQDDAALRWHPCGVVQIGRDAAHQELQRLTAERHAWPEAYLRYLDVAALSALLGRPAARGGWHFPGGGWLSAPSLCRALLAGSAVKQRYAVAVDSIAASDAGWLVRDGDGRVLGEAAHLILANAQQALRFQPDLPLQQVRGQLSCLPAAPFAGLGQVVCCKSYLIPAAARPDSVAYLGASFDVDDADGALRLDSHRENLAGLEAMLPGSTRGIAAPGLPGRVGFRSMSPDRLPLVGSLPSPQEAIPSDLKLGQMARQKGLHCLLGYGARGMVWAPLMAELLAAQLEAEALPLEAELVAALDPARFLFRRLRRG